jgi:hypothetical protein
VKAEYSATAGIWLKQIGKPRFDTGALVRKGKRSARCRKVIWNTLAVLCGLKLNAGECVAFLLRLDNAYW